MSDVVVLVDAGPLIALFHDKDRHHVWANYALEKYAGSRLLTCEAALTEATHKLGSGSPYCLGLVEAVERGLVQFAFDLSEQIQRVRWLMNRYASVPMSLADACLVRMSELHARSVVWTADSDFTVYRRHGRERIPTMMPR